MNVACTTTAAALPTVVASSGLPTPPLGSATASTMAAHHFRIGPSSRRSSSSGSSSGGSNAAGTANMSAVSGGMVGSREQNRKRRRHSTLSSSGFASGDSDNDAPPTFRLRLGSYVSDFRLRGGRRRRRRSHSSSPQVQSPSPSGLVRHRHQLRNQTSLSDKDQVASSVSPTTITQAVSTRGDTADVEMDLDVQNTFQAMQVDSPAASPSSLNPISTSFFSSSANPLLIPSRSSSTLALHRRPSPIPSGLFQPLQTDTRYPTRSPSARSTPASVSLPSIPMVAHANASPFTPGVFPTQSTILAARRNSRQPLSSSSKNAPVSPSPLAHSTSYTQQSSHQHFQHSSGSSLQHSSSFRGRRSRSTSTPPDPSLSEEVLGRGGEGQVPPSPVRRHSDGKAVPFPLRYEGGPF
ncbi:uncharacterized protein UHOD_00329 [Ustilago sp. UG-2017b]|nr:uncharacterized protein UHOD_00329 [Ustilago sp. UG-2017b]